MKTEAFPTLIYRYHLDDTEQVKARVEEYYKEYKFQNNAPDPVSYTHLRAHET